MTAEERRAYIRQKVDAAPALTSEDAALLRALLPLGARRAAQARTTSRLTQPSAARKHAA